VGFSIASFNVRDLFDDTPPHVIGDLDRGGFGKPEQLRAQELYRARLERLAGVLRRLDADILAFQEVKNARVLNDLRQMLPSRGDLPAGGYGPAQVAAADDRGIACGLLSRFPVVASVSHSSSTLAFPTFVAGDAAPWSSGLSTRRAVLEAEITLPDHSSLCLFVVHLKSNLPEPLLAPDGSPVPFSDHRSLAEGRVRSLIIRVAEALFVRNWVDARFDQDPRAQIAVAGDFNDQEESAAVRSVTGDLSSVSKVQPSASATGLWQGRGMYACARAVPPSLRYSLIHQGSAVQIDHVLVSQSLWERFVSARFFNETLREDAASVAESALSLASDHAPLRTEFR
jgi:endonuclease/exonuclease/phosphatase family metal-dependent hydrolase